MTAFLPGRSRRLPLRWRVAVAFALTSLLVTGLLALITWNLASDFMLDQEQRSATGQATTNVQLVRSYLQRSAADNPVEALSRLDLDRDATLALRTRGQWVQRGRGIDTTALSDQLLADAGVDTPPRRTVIGGLPVFTFALPIPEHDTLYVELSSLGELEQALGFLRTVLIAGTGASVLLGLVLGRWAARQALRPLRELNLAAGRVAGGDLRARLPEDGDADLAPLATTFNQTTDALERRVASDARFAGDVSHELRSPLTTMLNAIAVLDRRKAELSPVAMQALRLLSADIQRFHQMVIDLLEISREQSSTDDRELEPCDLAELVRHALAGRPEDTPLSVPAGHPVVLADRRRLDRAVANLLDNAAQHAGGAVRVTVLRRGDVARLEVDDAGPGIPAELREQVFERFTRGNRSGDRGNGTGTGLGLALVAQHVRRHHGKVWSEDRAGGGTRFVIELPSVPE